jgi:hypothetical protein
MRIHRPPNFLTILSMSMAVTLAATPIAGAHAGTGSARTGVHHRHAHVERAVSSRVHNRLRLSVSTQSPTSGQTVSGTVNWVVAVSGATPSLVTFSVDGSVKGSLSTGPFAYPLDTTRLSNGSHVLTATASGGRKVGSASSSITVEVSNSLAAPPSSPEIAPETSPTPSEPSTTPVETPSSSPPPPTPEPSSLYWGAWIGKQFTGQEAPWDMNAV